MLADFHTHAFAPQTERERDEISERDATFAEMYANPAAKLATGHDLLQALDAAGIDRAVVAGFAFAHERDLAAQNEHLLAVSRESGRLWPLATVNPALGGWRAGAEAAMAGGARGFGELRPWSQGWDPLGHEGQALCALANETGGVLLWHVSELVGHRYPGKSGGILAHELARLAEAFPGVRMIAAHLGGGLPFFMHMAEVRAAIKNVYFDTAASTLLYDDASVTYLVAQTGPGRVLFGSDYPLLSPRRQLQRLQALLPGDVAKAVCGGNAASLFSEHYDA
ncbi:MAG: amidohydrolase family protein [Dehalococcoidia bacterium]|nr:amidohydrolase family protein [Dehalococcoidia bacterium]